MFKAFLKIIPQLEASALNTLESSLNSRFARVAKRFAGGLKNAILGGGIAALGLGVIDKLLNPLKQVNEHIDSIFDRAKDLTDQAQQFGTTAGTLLKLQTIGKASGVGPEELSVLLAKFQAALTQARANPGQPSAVSQFIGEKDTADAFFKFLQGLKGAGQLNRDLATQDVFGERKVLSVSKLLSSDLDKKLAQTAGINTSTVNANVGNALKKEDYERTKLAVIDAQHFSAGAGSITNDIVNARVDEAKRAADTAQYQLTHIKGLQNIHETVDKIQDGLTRMLTMLGDAIGKFQPMIKSVEKIANSRLIKLLGKKLGIGD